MHRRWPLVMAMACALSACAWTQPHFDAGQTANNVFETAIGRGDVARLVRSWSVPAPAVGSYQTILVHSGRVFASNRGRVEAFRADTGSPLWSWPGHTSTSPALSSETAVVARPGGGDLLLVGEQFIGSPLDPRQSGWTTALDAATGAVVWSWPEGRPGGVVIGRTLFTPADRHVGDASDFSGTIAFDVATGVVRFRVPGFMANAATADTVFGETASGEGAVPVMGCGAGRCAPLWTARYAAPPWLGRVAVANDRLYLAGLNGLEVFPASGCGAPTCEATWTAAGSYGAIAVTADRLFLNGNVIHATGPNVLSVFDAKGCGAATCAPMWSSATSRDYLSPVVANGLVYLSSRGSPTEAWSTDGCGSPTCAPVWSSSDALQTPVTPVVVGGRLILAASGIQTYVLPAD